MSSTERLVQIATTLREYANLRAKTLTYQSGGQYEMRDSVADAQADLAEEVLSLRRELLPLG